MVSLHRNFSELVGKIILAVSHFSSVTGEAGHLFLFFYISGKCLFIACLLFTTERLSFIKLLNYKSALNITTLTLNNTRTCCKSSHSPPVPCSPTSPWWGCFQLLSCSSHLCGHTGTGLPRLPHTFLAWCFSTFKSANNLTHFSARSEAGLSQTHPLARGLSQSYVTFQETVTFYTWHDTFISLPLN